LLRISCRAGTLQSSTRRVYRLARRQQAVIDRSSLTV
jgi:hypothetical protein